MKILAIETSCDDTGVAILEIVNNEFKALSNVVASQIEVHKQYGGVFPTMAKREHQKNLLPAFTKALKESKLLKPRNSKLGNQLSQKIQTLKTILEREEVLLKNLEKFLKKYEKPEVDAIAITNGPGLEPCLWVGVNFVAAISFYWNIPIIPVNHIEGHILVNFINNEKLANNKKMFPAISLVVSGGHTQIILVKGIGKYQILGETRDDAAGECFDKAAKILGLGYPGGPIIGQLATKARPSQNVGSPTSHFLPRPMINDKNYDFSFSGLKTAVLYHHKKQNIKTQKSKEYIAKMAVEIQQAIIDVLIKKTLKAAKDYNAKTIILGGGVSANKELQHQLGKKIKKEIPGAEFLIPNPKLSTDNGLMIAIAGYFNLKSKTANWKKLKAEANLRI
jgi:N6-L-threonylcarbamoyladenine synthase